MRTNASTWARLIYFSGYALFFFPYVLGDFSALSGAILMLIGMLLAAVIRRKVKFQLLLIVSFFFILLLFSARSAEPLALLYSVAPFLFLAAFALFECWKVLTFENHAKVFYALAVTMAVIGIYQYAIDPSLGGYAINRIYNESVYGTSTFRITSVFGSVQNNALLYGVALFIRSERPMFERFLTKAILIIAGLMTLSTFFGGCLLVYMLARLPNIGKGVVFALVVMFLSLFDFRNTPLESFSFVEILGFTERYFYQPFELDVTDLLFGKGIGLASQGMIDRGVVFEQTLETESSFVVYLYERGLVFTMFILSVGIYRFHAEVKRFGIRDVRPYFYFVLIVNFLLVPAFSSLRIIMIFMTFFVVKRFSRHESESRSTPSQNGSDRSRLVAMVGPARKAET